MESKKKRKKHYPTDIPLCENVKLLKCGAWGYIHNGKAAYKSTDVQKVNAFSNWVTFVVTNEGEQLQLTEGKTDVMPQIHDSPLWRVEGHNYESQTKIPKG